MREIKFREFYKKENIMYRDIDISNECLPIHDNNVVIMQYTGFKIKNIEIYENDIIRARKDYLYKVVFENGSFVLYHLNKYDGQELIRWGLLSRLFDSDMKDILEESEIVGNIYENPELLELE